MSDPMEINNTVYVAIQHVKLVGVFTTLDGAKAACQAHYDRYVTLVKSLEPGALDWQSFVDLSGAPYEAAHPDKRANGQAVYQINPVPVNVNLRAKAQV